MASENVSSWASAFAAAMLLCGCFDPEDPPPLDTDDGTSSSGGSMDASNTDPTEPSTSGPTTEPTGETDDPTGETDDPTGDTDDPTGDTDDPTDPTDSTDTDDPTTTGVEPACDDGNADPGELCLDMPPNMLMAPAGPVDVALGDISSNGLMDIVVLARGDDATDVVVTLEADGVGGFVNGTTEPVPSPAARLRLGDMDNDDDLDVVVHAGDIVWLRNQGSFFLDYEVASNFAGTWSVSDVFLADINEDGVLDVGYSEAYGRAWVGGVLTNGVWTPGPSGSFPGPGEGAAGMAVGVLSQDGDDDLDVIAFNQYYSAALMLPGNGGGGFTEGPEVEMCTSDIDGVRYGEIADFNDDGMSDIVVTCMDGDGAVSLGTADGFGPPSALPLAGAFKPSVADLDGDGDDDVLLASSTLDRAVMFINDGSGAFELADRQFMAPGPVYAAVAGDLNDDGATDVVVIAFPDGPGAVAVYTATP
ncbi:MAG: FG-GAP-like repeat-containing protein [Nannocystaceae bacterium]|nr:FG-GAP-like repeat-containing protein [bacterium]